jgi:hypothetical protein
MLNLNNNNTNIVTSSKLYYCSIGKQLKQNDKFYPSSISRRVNNCKMCLQHKFKKRKEKSLQKQNMIKIAPRKKEIAFRMLQKLKQVMKNAETTGNTVLSNLHPSTQNNTKIQFGIQATRAILHYWSNRSALYSSSSGAIANDNFDVNNETIHQKALELIIWNNSGDDGKIFPYHVIPVTRSEARLLQNVPVHIRHHILAPDTVTRINTRLATLAQCFQTIGIVDMSISQMINNRSAVDTASTSSTDTTNT